MVRVYREHFARDAFGFGVPPFVETLLAELDATLRKTAQCFVMFSAGGQRHLQRRAIFGIR